MSKQEEIWHPILFKGELVRQIIAGNKTQTRRIMRKQPPTLCNVDGPFFVFAEFYTPEGVIKSPYGAARHKLWIRETWATDMCFDNVKPSSILTEAEAGKPVPIWYASDDRMLWYTDNGLVDSLDSSKHFQQDPRRGKNRPSIFMPRWASLNSLLVRRVWCERLQVIDNDYALAEGVTCEGLRHDSAVDAFAELWDSVNVGRKDHSGHGVSWRDNPFVWVIEFEVIK